MGRAGAGGRGAGGPLPFLPPSSPDLNPIELAFAKLKPAPPVGRTVDGRWRFLGRGLEAFGRDECRNYFCHRGYTAAGE